jgi:hypothetical protein
MVIPVGLPPEEILQLPRSEPPTMYLKTLSVEVVLLTSQMLVPSVPAVDV